MMNLSDKNSSNSYEFKNLSGFPITLFHFHKYDGLKALAAFLFLITIIYFVSGFWGFLIDHNAWLKGLIYEKPPIIPIEHKHWWEFWKGSNIITDTVKSTFSYIDLFFRGFILLCSYCFAWAIFDPKNIEVYVMGIVNIASGIVYILSGIDFLPDFLPLVGNLDDAFLGSGMLLLGVSGIFRNFTRQNKTKTILELVNDSNREKALNLLLEDKGITIKERKR